MLRCVVDRHRFPLVKPKISLKINFQLSSRQHLTLRFDSLNHTTEDSGYEDIAVLDAKYAFSILEGF